MDDIRLAALWRHVKLRWRLASSRLVRDLAVWYDIRVFPPLALLAGLNCVAAMIVMRQRSGGLPLTMSNWRLSVAAASAAGLTIASRWLLARIENEPPAFRIRVLLAALSVFPLIVLLTMATPRNSVGAIGFVSLLAVAAGNANLLWNRRNSQPRRLTRAFPDRPAEAAQPFVPAVDETPALLPTPAAGAWTERSHDAHGQLLLRGKVSARFSPGQSLTTVHIPFIPVLPRVPEFSCEIIDQPAVRARSPVVYRFGARIELKRAGDIGLALDVEVEFRATLANTERAA